MVKKLQKFRKSSRVQKSLPLLVILIVSVIGVYLWNASKAASPYVSNEAESGTLADGATSFNDSTANGGSGVRFGGVTPPPPDGTFNTSFVTRQGTQFKVGSSVFRFTGANVYNAAGVSSKYTCGPTFSDAQLDAAFSTLRSSGAGVIRFWAYQSYTNGGTDWSQIDRVVNTARKYSLKVMPTLENHWSHCTKADFNKDTNWYSNGYKSPYSGYPLSYRDYAKAIVTRYKDEPVIMAWMLMNEAEGENSALYTIASDVSALIKSLDSKHLVTLGTLANNGQKGTTDSSNNYAKLYGLDTIDFADAHDYDHDQQALPRSQYDVGEPLPDPNTCLNSIACAMSVAVNRLNKPFIIGEAGITASTDATSKQKRMTLMDAKMQAHWDNKGSGYILWQYSVGGPGDDNDAYKFFAGDPILGLLSKYGSPLNK